MCFPLTKFPVIWQFNVELRETDHRTNQHEDVVTYWNTRYNRTVSNMTYTHNNDVRDGSCYSLQSD